MTEKEKYDKALEKAKEIIKDYKDHNRVSVIIEHLETIFPELKESDDERIRKALVELVKCNERSGYTILNDVSTSSILDWLEKQSYCSAKWEKNTTNNKPILNHSVLMKNIYGIAEGEWNGEEWIQYRWRWSSRIKDNDVLYWMDLSELEKQCDKVLDCPQNHLSNLD